MLLKAPTALPTGNDESYLDEPGTYHVLIKKSVEDEDSQGNCKEGAIAVKCEVLAGTSEKCAGKIFTLTLFPDGGTEKMTEICQRAQAAYCFATNLVKPTDFGGEELDINVDAAVNSQCFVRLELQDVKGADGVWHKPGPDDKRFLRVSYDNFFHVDDPKMSKMPRDAAAIAHIDPGCRLEAEVFEQLRSGGSQAQKLTAATSTAADDF